MVSKYLKYSCNVYDLILFQNVRPDAKIVTILHGALNAPTRQKYQKEIDVCPLVVMVIILTTIGAQVGLLIRDVVTRERVNIISKFESHA